MNIQQQLGELRETLHGQPSTAAYGRVRDLVLAIEDWDGVELAVNYVSGLLEVQPGWGRYLERWEALVWCLGCERRGVNQWGRHGPLERLRMRDPLCDVDGAGWTRERLVRSGSMVVTDTHELARVEVGAVVDMAVVGVLPGEGFTGRVRIDAVRHDLERGGVTVEWTEAVEPPYPFTITHVIT